MYSPELRPLSVLGLPLDTRRLAPITESGSDELEEVELECLGAGGGGWETNFGGRIVDDECKEGFMPARPRRLVGEAEGEEDTAHLLPQDRVADTRELMGGSVVFSFETLAVDISL